MKFVNEKENQCKFGDLGIGDYYRDVDDFYVKVNIKNENGDYYSINLGTGDGIATPFDARVTAIEVTKIIYRDD